MSRFFEHYENNIKQPTVLASLIDGMEHVVVNSSIPNQVRDGCRVFTIISRNLRVWLVKPKKNEQKYALAGLLGTIFAPLASAPLVSDADSRNHAQSLYELIEANMKKSKNPHLLPIAVCTLCISSAQIFHEKFDSILELLLIMPKESILRSLFLEHMYTLLYASMTKYDDKNEGRRQRIRGVIAAQLYPIGKKLNFLTELEHIDIIVDIIELLSIHDIESVVSSIIIPFLQIQQPIISEHILIGFISLMKIYHQVISKKSKEEPQQQQQDENHQNSNSSNETQDLSTMNSKNIIYLMLPFYEHTKCLFRKKTLNSLVNNIEKKGLKIGEAHIKQASQCAASVLSSFHGSISAFSKLNGQIQLDSLPREKLFQIYAVEAAVSSIFICIPGTIHCMELLGYLSQYTIHNYFGLAQISTAILRHITKTKPSFRSAIVHAFARFARIAPDAEPQLMSKSAENYLELLRIWYHQIKENENENQQQQQEFLYEFENKSDLQKPNFPQIESLGLLYLCSPHSHTRTMGYEIIKTSAVLHEHCKQTLGDITPSIFYLIIEKAPSIIQKSYFEPFYVNNENIFYSFSTSTLSPHLPKIVPTLDQFISIFQNEKDGIFNFHQQQWSRILAGILQVIASECIETAKEFWKCVRERIIPVYQLVDNVFKESSLGDTNVNQNQLQSQQQQQLNTSTALQLEQQQLIYSIHSPPMNILTNKLLSPSIFDEHVILWSNYIHSTIGCASANDSSIFEQSSNDKIIQSARDLFKIIIPTLKSESYIISITGKSALSFLPPLCVESFITELGTFYKLAFLDDKVKSKTKQNNAILLSYCYHLISKNHSDGYYFNEKGILNHHLSYIQHQLDKIPEISNAQDSILDILYWRYHLCLTIDLLYHDLILNNGSECRSLIDDLLYQKIFSFLTFCSGYADTNNALNEQQKNKERKLFMNHSNQLDEFEKQAEAVQVAASKAISTLCFGICNDNEEKSKFTWISNIFSSGQIAIQPIAQKALINLLRSNLDKRELFFKKTIDLCYSSDHKISSWSFYTLVEILSHGNIPIYPHILLCLALHKMGDSIERVRHTSVILMTLLSEENYFPGDYPLVQNSGAFDCYYHSQLQVALRVSVLHPSVSIHFIDEAFHRFRIIDGPARERLLHIIAPFFSHINLKSDFDTRNCCAFLERLLVVTLKYGEEFTFSVEASWRNLAHSKENIIYILNYLISLSCNLRVKSLLLICCKVTLLISRSLPEFTVEKLVYELFNTQKIGKHYTPEEFQENTEQNMETQALMVSSWAKDFVFMFPPLLHQLPYSRSNIALILLCEIILENFNVFINYLHIVILCAFLAQDSSNFWVIKFGKTILANILFSALGSKNYRSIDNWILEPLTTNNNFDNSIGLWNKSEFICRDGTIDTREHFLRKFLISYLHLIEKAPFLSNYIGGFSKLKENFAMVALRWATFSTSSHYICRSLQIFRFLDQPLHVNVLSKIVFCIQRHIENRDASGSRDVMFEGLCTLHSVSQSSSLSDIIKNPQLLWTTLSCLQSDSEEEYWLVLDLLAVLLQQIDFDDDALKKTIRSKPPGDWVVSFTGIQPLILKGFTSHRVEDCARALVSEFLLIDCPELIDSSSTRYLDNIIVLLPYLMENIIATNEEIQQETLRITQNIMSVCQSNHWNEMLQVFQNYLQGEFDDGSLFLKKLSPSFYSTLVKGYELRIFSLLRCYIWNGKRFFLFLFILLLILTFFSLFFSS